MTCALRVGRGEASLAGREGRTREVMVGDHDRKELGSSSEGLENPRRKAHLEDNEGPQKVLDQGRETCVKKAVFRLTALHPFRFGTFLGRPLRTQVRILWGWGGGGGVHGASGSGGWRLGGGTHSTHIRLDYLGDPQRMTQMVSDPA